MSGSDHQVHVTRALEVLTVGLIPFVEGELRAVYQGSWSEQIRPHLRDQPVAIRQASSGIQRPIDTGLTASAMTDLVDT